MKARPRSRREFLALSRRALPFKQEGRTVRLEIPTLVDYEVIAFT